MSVVILAPQPHIRRLLWEAVVPIAQDIADAPAGEALWEFLRRQSPALLIATWPPPGFDTPALLRAVRRPEGGYTYVLLLGPPQREPLMRSAVAAGVDEYLVTPFRRAELHARVRAALRIAALEDRAATLAREYEKAQTHDLLTGVLSRQAFSEALAERSHAAGPGTPPLSLIRVRIARLAALNQTLGYAAGDRAIQHVAALVAGNLRQGDLLGRWTGTTLLVALPNVDRAAAAHVAARIQARVASTPARYAQHPIALDVQVHLATARFAPREGGAGLAVAFAPQAIAAPA